MNFYQTLKKNGFFSKNLIYNKTVLYLIFIIALTNLFIIFQQNDIFSIVFFLLIGFLTSFFSKNMIVILCMCIFFTNVLKYGRTAAGHSQFEGFGEGEEEGKVEDEAEKEKEKEDGEEVKEKKKEAEKSKEESFKPEKKDDKEPMVLEQEKLLDNMNKYKSLLDTLQGITENMKELKGKS
jgi:hypothetical protein